MRVVRLCKRSKGTVGFSTILSTKYHATSPKIPMMRGARTEASVQGAVFPPDDNPTIKRLFGALDVSWKLVIGEEKSVRDRRNEYQVSVPVISVWRQYMSGEQ